MTDSKKNEGLDNEWVIKLVSFTLINMGIARGASMNPFF